MKKILSLIVLMLSTTCFSQKVNTCPVTGDNNGTTKAALHHQKVDSYKNRGTAPKHYTQIQFDVMAGLTVKNPIGLGAASGNKN